MSFEIGVFTKIFVRAALGDALAAIRAYGMTQTQFNLACVGLESLPARIEPALAETVRAEFVRHEMHMAAVSGTFNMIHPDEQVRAEGLRRLRGVIAACAGLGTNVVTLCSGTRDPHNMWHGHPENSDPEAWRDLTASLEQVLPDAEAHGVILAFEPEPENVIDRPAKGRQLIAEMGSPNLKVVMDSANLFHPGELGQMEAVLLDAFEQLGGEIVLAHAKDLSPAGEVVAAGKGVLDYPRYLELLRQCGYSGPLVMHSLREEEVAGSVAFLRKVVGER
jgi:sugar phosphate isomerase/epimerase